MPTVVRLSFVVCAIAVLVSAAFAVGANLFGRLAQAEATGSVAVGCESLARYVDGDPDDPTVPADEAEACGGISQQDAANLANALGDQDNELEHGDFSAIDVDANQIEDGLDAADCDTSPLQCRGTMLMFVFVDDDEPVTFDAPSGLNQSPVDASDVVAVLSQDYVCDTAAEDLDCDHTTSFDGDGVVVTRVVDGAAGDPGELLNLDAEQADEPDTETSQTFLQMRLTSRRLR